LPPTELRVALRPGAQPHLGAKATTKAAVLLAQEADPFGNGVYIALLLGSGCALLLSLIGFLTSNALTIQARQVDWAVLETLGLSRRELLGLIAVEQGAVLGGSLLAGAAVGLLLAALTRPLIQVVAGNLEQTTGVVEWQGTLLLAAGLLIVLGVALILLLINVQRRGMTRVLRLGDV
jgi:putative ABC transport system permease protein